MKRIQVIILAVTLPLVSSSVVEAAAEKPSLPKEVQAIIERQIKTYFGTNDVAGIPLADPNVDWFNFTNWPDKFECQGQTYDLRLRYARGHLVTSDRSELKPADE